MKLGVASATVSIALLAAGLPTRSNGQIAQQPAATNQPAASPTAGVGPAASTSFRLPVLTVGADNTGSLLRVNFTVSRERDRRTPLTIAIAEDTPGGTGESLRASIWLAATVAALDRLDDLSGTRIYMDLPGQVDGPSAGGVICLAILSALDGRPLPDDFAMTGAIMPDGTIAAVGGVAAKIRAAANAGAKRVLIPAYLRFEEDAKTKAQVDLKRLAASLNLEYLPVNNIRQAYRIIHRLLVPSEVRAEDNVLDLPDATEEFLKQAYRDEMKAATKLWDAIPKEQQEQIGQDPFSRPLLIGIREKAEAAFRSGKLLYATDDAQTWRMFLEARADNVAMYAALTGKDFKENLTKLDAKLKELMQAVPDPASLVQASKGKLSDSGVQLCAGYCDIFGLIGVINQFQNYVDEAVGELPKPENQGDDKQNQLIAKADVARAIQLIVARVVRPGSDESVAFAAELGKTLPKRDITGDVTKAERLFYCSYLAALHSFETDVVNETAGELNLSADQTLAAMAQRDGSVAMILPVTAVLPALHQSVLSQTGKKTNRFLQRDAQSIDPEARFTAAAAAHMYADNLAKVSGLIARWGPQLDPAIDDQGNLQHRRVDALNYLLSSARDTALANIAECRRCGIPCIEPIVAFQRAELSRDDNGEDKIDVLRDYWNASLQAKLLLILFVAKS